MAQASMNPHENLLELEDEIVQLEARLAEAKKRLSNNRRQEPAKETERRPRITPLNSAPQGQDIFNASSHHYLLLLSDSALPLGSFAFSSGLESYIAHARGPSNIPSSSSVLPQQAYSVYNYRPTFTSFLPLSLSSYASTNLPFALAAYRSLVSASSSVPGQTIAELDDTLDASIICTVGRRASIAQGRALLSIWEKSLSVSVSASAAGVSALEEFSALLRRSTFSSSSTSTSASTKAAKQGNGAYCEDDENLPPPVSAHLAPLFGAVAACMGLSLRQTAYVFLLSHAKALVSAAVRAGMFGPYQAQKILAGAGVQALIGDLVEREWHVPVEEAAQSVPVMDLWIGRHEMLYSRIFNS